MADVKICDRCKKVLDDKRGRVRLKQAKRHILNVTVFKQGYTGEFVAADTHHDLCENCTKKLIDFLEGKAVEATNNT